MSALSQPKYVGDWLKFEEENNYCRKAVTILSGQKLESGAVVATRNDGGNAGKYVAYDSDGANGIDAATGILVYAVDASATGANADTPGVIINRGPAIVNPNQLTWTGQDDAAIAAGLVDLLALGIVAGTGE